MTSDSGLEGLLPILNRRDGGTRAADAVHQSMREAIVSGQLAPGARLGEEDLARTLQVSRTPVREALFRLESERLTIRNDRGGLVVAEVTADDIVELDVVRQAVDGLAARLASEVARTQDVERLRWLNDELRTTVGEGDARSMAATNLRFHEGICVVGRNTILLDMMRSLHGRVIRFHGTTFSNPGRPATALDEHERIIDAIEASDADRAERMAREHIAKSMEVRSQMLREARDSRPHGF